MARELTRKELQAQLAAERARSDAMAAKLSALEQPKAFSRDEIQTEAMSTDLETFEQWRNAGLARGYKHPLRTGKGQWVFFANGRDQLHGILGAWDDNTHTGHFIERRAL